MTLKEKFENYFDPKWLDKDVSAHYCEQIADQYAISFGEYLDSLTAEDMGDLTIKELLGIFKKEKGL